MSNGNSSKAAAQAQYMLSESHEVLEEEREDSTPLVAMTGHGVRQHEAKRSEHGQSWSGSNAGRDYRDSDDENEGDEDQASRQNRAYDRTGYSDLNQRDHHTSRGSPDLEDGENEKSFRYFQHLPDPDKLHNASVQVPGIKAIASGLAIMVGVGYLIAYLCTSITRYSHVTKVNVILMVSDGFGPASETFARSYLQHLISIDDPLIQPAGRWASLNPANDPDSANTDASSKSKYALQLPLDTMLIGQSRTRSSDSLVTDSAAGATAFSCGLKSFNGAIAVEPEHLTPCGTVLEAARHQGYKTGLVVTSRITHATPAAFYAHVPDRDMESAIAEQMVATHPLGQQLDLAFGGGLCFFLPNSSQTSCRTDNKDVIALAKAKKNSKPKYNVITTRQEFDAVPADANGIGTIALLGADHLEYEIDRWTMSEKEEERQPSLEDMAVKAIDILRASSQRDSAHGFFLMIEGSRIDMAGHGNDPVGHVHEILSYQSTVKKVAKRVDSMNKAGNPTVIISVSDHETGGLSLAHQLSGTYPEYAWYPDALVNGTTTAFAVARKIRQNTDTIDIETIKALLRNDLGVSDPDDVELAAIIENKDIDQTAELWVLSHVISRLTSRRAQIGWSTEGHSGVDVNLYGYPRSVTSVMLGGNRENTEIGDFIAKTMKLNLKQITKSLSHNMAAWYSSTSEKLQDASRLHTTTEVQHYHGDHRH